MPEDTPVVVLIPMRDRLDLTETLLDQLESRAGRCDEVIVLDNGSKPETVKVLLDWRDAGRATVVDAAGYSIYQMWNKGWDLALAWHLGPVNLAILNNDIEVPAGFLDVLSTALRARLPWPPQPWLVYPDYRFCFSEDVAHYRRPEKLTLMRTAGSYRHGGMCGWAFMVAAERRREGLPRVDERFGWWCGDDDLAFAVEAAGGGQYRVRELPVFHHGSATAVAFDLGEQQQADMALCAAKWGR